MRVATSPGRISSTANMKKETSRSVKSAITRRWAISLVTNTDDQLRWNSSKLLAKLPRRAYRPPGEGVFLLAAAQIFKIEIEVLRPRRIAGAALAQGQNLVDEHRDDGATFIGEQLADLLVKLEALGFIDRGVGLEKKRIIVGPLPVRFLPLGAL